MEEVVVDLRAAMKSLALVWEFINARLFDPVYCRSISANTDVTCICKVRITQNSAFFFCYDNKWSFKVSEARPFSSSSAQREDQRVAWFTPSSSSGHHPVKRIRAITLPKKVTWDIFQAFARNVEQVKTYLRQTDANVEIILTADEVVFTDRNNGFALHIDSTSRDPLELAEMHSSGEGMSTFRPQSRTWIPEADLRPLKTYFRSLAQAQARITDLVSSPSSLAEQGQVSSPFHGQGQDDDEAPNTRMTLLNAYDQVIRETCSLPQTYEKAYQVAAVASLAKIRIQSSSQPPLEPAISHEHVQNWCRRIGDSK